MLGPLLTSLNSLRDFFSRAFFISAFVPTLVFLFINALILFLWSGSFNVSLHRHFLDAPPGEKSLTFAMFFFLIWISSYVTAALTGFWIRTLEGTNWWEWLRKPGMRFHVARFRKITTDIEQAVSYYSRIEKQWPSWLANCKSAAQPPTAAASAAAAEPVIPPNIRVQTTRDQITNLKSLRISGELISFDEMKSLMETWESELRQNPNDQALKALGEEIKLLENYACDRAKREQMRLLNLRNSDFGNLEEIRPTRFGNIGLLAEAHAKRAYGCNLVLIWSELRRAADADDKTTKAAIDDCKVQLDFFVASFWLLC